MKAKTVSESISFERGLEPKKSLGLGIEWTDHPKLFPNKVATSFIKELKRNNIAFKREKANSRWSYVFFPDEEAAREIAYWYEEASDR